MKLLLCAVAGIVLGLVVGFLSGRATRYQRFVMTDVGAAALDTKTGQLCNPMTQHPDRISTVPLCYELYKQ